MLRTGYTHSTPVPERSSGRGGDLRARAGDRLHAWTAITILVVRVKQTGVAFHWNGCPVHEWSMVTSTGRWPCCASVAGLRDRQQPVGAVHLQALRRREQAPEESGEEAGEVLLAPRPQGPNSPGRCRPHLPPDGCRGGMGEVSGRKSTEVGGEEKMRAELHTHAHSETASCWIEWPAAPSSKDERPAFTSTPPSATWSGSSRGEAGMRNGGGNGGMKVLVGVEDHPRAA